MFSYYPRSNPYYAPSYLGYAPAAHYGASPASFFGDGGRAFPRRRPEENAWMRSARRTPFEYQRRAFSPDDDDDEDLYDQKRRAYLQAKEYEQELRRAQELEAQGRMRRAQGQQRRKAPQQQTPPEPDLEEDVLSADESNEAASSSVSDAVVPQERLEAAAIVIQQAWRRHLAFQRIQTLESEFDTLKSSFSFPSTLDFTPPSPSSSNQPISLPTASTSAITSPSSAAKLAYTKNNAPLHAHVEALSRLLVKLDEIDSCGLKSIRERRKAVIRSIEDEAENLEARWRGVWAAYQAKSLEGEENDSDEEFFDVADMVVDDDLETSMSEDLSSPEGEESEKSISVDSIA